MKTILAVLAGISLTLAAVAIWQPSLAWIFTRIPPATHPDCAPRYLTWHGGVMTEGPWT